MGYTFPNEFDAPEGSCGSYRPGTLARLLDTPGLVDSLSDQDAKALQQFYPKFVKGLEFSVRSAKNMRLVAEGMEATRTVYLEKVITEFEKKLSRNSNEHTWQKFLRQHILLLLNTYAAVIEKQSIDLDGKYPDFMLVDAYGYLDIYEIKKPQTRVLKRDSSRDNYYWDVEVAKAISQVENYADSTQTHHLELAQKVLRKDGRDIRIVRPRGYIIAGRRADLEGNPKMEEDFRLLNDSLKNVDIIFYDDLLDNVKALYKRLASSDGLTKSVNKTLTKKRAKRKTSK